MKQTEMVNIINESIETANKLMLKWTNNCYFLGSSSPRLEGFMGSIIMQNIMQKSKELHVVPELYLNNFPQFKNEDVKDNIDRKGRLDIAVFNKKWKLLYPIEIKRERVDIDIRSKMKRGCIKDLIRLAEIQNFLSSMKAGVLAVFIFEKSNTSDALEKKINKRKQFWKKELDKHFVESHVKGVNILAKFSGQPPQKWVSKNSKGKEVHYIATSLCIVVKSL